MTSTVDLLANAPGRSSDFGRPLAAVRAYFSFWMSILAVRGKIHRGMRLQWLPRLPSGERRVRQQTSVLDRIQIEEIVVEEGSHGEWIKRFVDGPNAGTRFVGRFEAEGNAMTRVKLEAFVGPRGFAQGLGKLSALGLEKALSRLLFGIPAGAGGLPSLVARGVH